MHRISSVKITLVGIRKRRIVAQYQTVSLFDRSILPRRPLDILMKLMPKKMQSSLFETALSAMRLVKS